MHNYTKIGKVLHHFISVDSTNNIAKDMLSKTKPTSGTVILADFQTSGRGQRANTWEAYRGMNILSSIILIHTIENDKYFYLNKIVCIALIETLNKFIPSESLQIKWPNDILVNNKKIAGILIENTIINNFINQSIIGIGLNINQAEFINKQAISIYNIKKSNTDIQLILDQLFESLSIWYQNLLTKNYKLIDTIYLNLLFGYNKDINYIVDNITYKGSIIAINLDGSILIKQAESDIISQFYFKEVQFIL